MFTIVGGDGNEYGPVDEAQVRGWLSGGRASLDTRARRDGESEWKALRDFPEFNPRPNSPTAAASAVPAGPGEFELASRLTRLGAALLDRALFFLSVLPGLVLVLFTIGTQSLTQGRPPTADELDSPRLLMGLLLIVAGCLCLIAIQVTMLSTRGQTLGKRALGIRITSLDGRNAGFVRAVLLRLVAPNAIILVFFWAPPLQLILILTDICFIFRADQRTLHDLLAGTRVVKV